MGGYDMRLSDAKRFATECLIRASKDTKADLSNLAGAIENLNKMWDELTDCLVRQRDERDRQILSLIDELAEAKKRSRP